MNINQNVTYTIELSNKEDVDDFAFILQLASDYIKEMEEKRVNTMIAPSAANEVKRVIEMYRAFF